MDYALLAQRRALDSKLVNVAAIRKSELFLHFYSLPHGVLFSVLFSQ